MSETVTGYIDHVIFRNEDNGYTVMVLKDTKKEEELTCVGSFPTITQGATIEATGVYTHHPVYGKQFQISSFVEKMPEDTYAIERYLGSGAIKGIGAALAARIVRRFGQDTLRIVEEEPERLAEVKGISEKKAREIAAQVTEKAGMRKAMIFLQKYGIKPFAVNCCATAFSKCAPLFTSPFLLINSIFVSAGYALVNNPMSLEKSLNILLLLLAKSGITGASIL